MIRFICSVFDCGNTLSDLFQYKYINNFLDSVNMTTMFFDFLIYSRLFRIKQNEKRLLNRKEDARWTSSSIIIFSDMNWSLFK